MCGRVFVIAVLASLAVPSVAVEIVAVDASAQFVQSLMRTKVDEAARAFTAASAVNAGAVETGKEALVVEAGEEQQEDEAKDEALADLEEDEDLEEEEKGPEIAGVIPPSAVYIPFPQDWVPGLPYATDRRRECKRRCSKNYSHDPRKCKNKEKACDFDGEVKHNRLREQEERLAQFTLGQQALQNQQLREIWGRLIVAQQRPQQQQQQVKATAPCFPLQAASAEYDVTQCESVDAGSTCIVRCSERFLGSAVLFKCPIGNTNELQQPEPMVTWPNCTLKSGEVEQPEATTTA